MTMMMMTTITMMMMMMMTNCNCAVWLVGPKSPHPAAGPSTGRPMFEHQQAPLLLLFPQPRSPCPHPCWDALAWFPVLLSHQDCPCRWQHLQVPSTAANHASLVRTVGIFRESAPSVPGQEKSACLLATRGAQGVSLYFVFISPALNIQRPNLTTRHREYPNCKVYPFY